MFISYVIIAKRLQIWTQCSNSCNCKLFNLITCCKHILKSLQFDNIEQKYNFVSKPSYILMDPSLCIFVACLSSKSLPQPLSFFLLFNSSFYFPKTQIHWPFLKGILPLFNTTRCYEIPLHYHRILCFQDQDPSNLESHTTLLLFIICICPKLFYNFLWILGASCKITLLTH